MLKKEYYCLVSGLPDLFFNENKLLVNSLELREELKATLSGKDFDYIKLLFLPFDNENLLTLRFNREKTFHNSGIFSKKDLEWQLSPENEVNKLPLYMLNFIQWIRKRESKELNTEVENILHGLFYEFALQPKNEFIQNWFMFELDTKNILTAFNCIRYGYELSEQLIKVKQNNNSYSLLLSKRLKHEYFDDDLPFSEQIFKVAEMDTSLFEREKALDKIKWDYLDEYTFFHYFTIEKIFSYVVKLLITERWLKLDTETGKSLLDRLMNDLKTSYEFPAEFSLMK